MPHRQKFARLLADNLVAGTFLAGWANIDVAVADRDGLLREPDQPLDVILLGIPWELEDDHVPPLRLAQRVSELAYQDPVAAEGRMVGIVGKVEHVGVTAIGADAGDDHRFGFGATTFETRAQREGVAAAVAGQIFVGPHQRRRHRSRWNHERLRDKGAE